MNNQIIFKNLPCTPYSLQIDLFDSTSQSIAKNSAIPLAVLAAFSNSGVSLRNKLKLIQ